ncbi:M23 family peptidase [Paenibacillus polymyxa]|nr:M23 family peptidase [Paenibacillus polymyxa]
MKIYCRHPFNTSERIWVTQGCGPGHIPPGKDLVFNGISYSGQTAHGLGTPVYAMESGTVRFIRRGLPHCPDPNNCPGNDNMILVEGSDRYYTGYHHVRPDSSIVENMSIPRGRFLGTVDDSGRSYGAHVHIGRYSPGNFATWWHSDRATCDWAIVGVDAPYVPLECMSHSPTPGHPHPWHLLP